MSEKNESKLVEVTLAKPHTHAGVLYPAGSKIKVDDPTAKWLVDNQVVNVNAAPVAAKEGAK